MLKFCEKETITIPINNRIDSTCAGLVIFLVAFGKYLAKIRPQIIGTPRSNKICSSIGRNGITSVGMSA